MIYDFKQKYPAQWVIKIIYIATFKSIDNAEEIRDFDVKLGIQSWMR